MCIRDRYYTGRVADDELVPTLKKAKTSEGKAIEIKAAIPDNTSTWIFNILSFIVPLILDVYKRQGFRRSRTGR